MKIEVIGKNGFNPSTANKEYAEKKLKKLNDFFGESNDLKALVVCKVYKQMHKVEITIPTKNLVMRAECNEQDLYAAIDRVVDKLLQQVRKHKTRVKSKLAKLPESTLTVTFFSLPAQVILSSASPVDNAFTTIPSLLVSKLTTPSPLTISQVGTASNVV